MKKVILFAAILFSPISIMNVQAEGASQEGQATLTLNLSAVQSIVVKDGVTIDYLTADDYANGKGSTQRTTLEITSAGNYAVSVKAADLTGPGNAIKANTIKIATELASADHEDGSISKDIETTTKTLANDAVSLISSTTGGTGIVYKVSYKGTGANEYYKNYNSTSGASDIKSYTTEVMYEITAK